MVWKLIEHTRSKAQALLVIKKAKKKGFKTKIKKVKALGGIRYEVFVLDNKNISWLERAETEQMGINEEAEDFWRTH